ncbi:McrC family protein [Microbulbifer sp. OS29]|uniref:McrC family protein n=1 Tax=Microbulbifer okhotskensis TaxID=2926617 RepID=A0A9X2J568_9GAMM|nr:McrC family protein [Microbulbifer okhotskensis]MCO1335277.1 McrC family protein [Microbulbifer okhotskensis]
MIQVREYATLHSDPALSASLDSAQVSAQTLAWLRELGQSQGNRFIRDSGAHSVKLGSYVGFLQSPTGEAIEILPKTHRQLPSANEAQQSRQLLQKMLAISLGISPRCAGPADLQRQPLSLHEWIFSQFLQALSRLLKRGLRSDYQRRAEESRFIRGRLNLARQAQQTPDRATWFHIEHDIFNPAIRENRLLKSALEITLKLCTTADNWRLANSFNHQMAAVPTSRAPLDELPKWRSGRLMQSYEPVKPWCRLILQNLNASFTQGEHRGIALLFPMERLFENYVAHSLRQTLPPSSRLRTHASNQYLLKHRPEGTETDSRWFQLRPDLLLESDTTGKGRPQVAVMDTKWKLLSSRASSSEKYKLSQADLYQLFAYGNYYMDGRGHMALIFPAHGDFCQPLPRFSFSDNLHLWALPFNLHSQQLVAGDWQAYFPGLLRSPKMETLLPQ